MRLPDGGWYCLERSAVAAFRGGSGKYCGDPGSEAKLVQLIEVNVEELK